MKTYSVLEQRQLLWQINMKLIKFLLAVKLKKHRKNEILLFPDNSVRHRKRFDE